MRFVAMSVLIFCLLATAVAVLKLLMTAAFMVLFFFLLLSILKEM